MELVWSGVLAVGEAVPGSRAAGTIAIGIIVRHDVIAERETRSGVEDTTALEYAGDGRRR